MPTLVHRIRTHAERHSGRPALFGPVADTWRQLSWGAWWSSIRQAAGGLISLGIRPGDAVLLWAPARPEWAVIWPALCAMGARALLLPPDADDDALLLATSEEQVPLAVTWGRDRLERVLTLRERGDLPLGGVVTLDRLDISGPRLLDIELLVERGVPELDQVERRMALLRGEHVATIFGDGRRITHAELLGAEPPEPMGRVGLVGALDGEIALGVMARAVQSGSELWVASEPSSLLAALHRMQPSTLCLDPAGCEVVADYAASRLSAWPGLTGLAARCGLGAARARVTAELGLATTRIRSSGPLSQRVLDRLGDVGIHADS